jgi:transposase InsO family protein
MVRSARKITKPHQDSDEVYGSPRVLANLRGDGEVVSRKTVAKVMGRLGLWGVYPKRFKTTTLRGNADVYTGDLADSQWDKGTANRFWIDDIMYLRTWEGWLYLATVIGAHTRWVKQACAGIMLWLRASSLL